MKWRVLVGLMVASLLVAACAPIPANYDNRTTYREGRAFPDYPTIVVPDGGPWPYFLLEGEPSHFYHHHDFHRDHDFDHHHEGDYDYDHHGFEHHDWHSHDGWHGHGNNHDHYFPH